MLNTVINSLLAECMLTVWVLWSVSVLSVLQWSCTFQIDDDYWEIKLDFLASVFFFPVDSSEYTTGIQITLGSSSSALPDPISHTTKVVSHLPVLCFLALAVNSWPVLSYNLEPHMSLKKISSTCGFRHNFPALLREFGKGWQSKKGSSFILGSCEAKYFSKWPNPGRSFSHSSLEWTSLALAW